MRLPFPLTCSPVAAQMVHARGEERGMRQRSMVKHDKITACIRFM
jgi:hypothetical protein